MSYLVFESSDSNRRWKYFAIRLPCCIICCACQASRFGFGKERNGMAKNRQTEVHWYGWFHRLLLVLLLPLLVCLFDWFFLHLLFRFVPVLRFVTTARREPKIASCHFWTERKRQPNRRRKNSEKNSPATLDERKTPNCPWNWFCTDRTSIFITTTFSPSITLSIILCGLLFRSDLLRWIDFFLQLRNCLYSCVALFFRLSLFFLLRVQIDLLPLSLLRVTNYAEVTILFCMCFSLPFLILVRL